MAATYRWVRYSNANWLSWGPGSGGIVEAEALVIEPGQSIQRVTSRVAVYAQGRFSANDNNAAWCGFGARLEVHEQTQGQDEFIYGITDMANRDLAVWTDSSNNPINYDVGWTVPTVKVDLELRRAGVPQPDVLEIVVKMILFAIPNDAFDLSYFVPNHVRYDWDIAFLVSDTLTGAP